jgi:hypothetical protein
VQPKRKCQKRLKNKISALKSAKVLLSSLHVQKLRRIVVQRIFKSKNKEVEDDPFVLSDNADDKDDDFLLLVSNKKELLKQRLINKKNQVSLWSLWTILKKSTCDSECLRFI